MNAEEPPSDPAYPVARRIQAHTSSFDRILLEMARKMHPTVAWWWGVRHQGSDRLARCYVCDEAVVSWSGGAHAPESVVAAIKRHRRDHIDQIMVQAATAEAVQ